MTMIARMTHNVLYIGHSWATIASQMEDFAAMIELTIINRLSSAEGIPAHLKSCGRMLDTELKLWKFLTGAQ